MLLNLVLVYDSSTYSYSWCKVLFSFGYAQKLQTFKNLIPFFNIGVIALSTIIYEQVAHPNPSFLFSYCITGLKYTDLYVIIGSPLKFLNWHKYVTRKTSLLHCCLSSKLINLFRIFDQLNSFIFCLLSVYLLINSIGPRL